MTGAETAEIHALKAAGLSLREISRRVGVSRPTVTKILAEPPPVPAHMAVASVPDMADAPAENAPAIEHARYLVDAARAALVEAQAVGDANLAQRHTRNLAGLLSVLARLERTERAEEDAIRISRAEVATIERSLRERIAATLSRPLLCAHCSRALSVSWGTEGLAEPDAADPGASAKSR